MTTEHVSVSRDELLGIAVELEENAVAQTGAASRQSLTSAHKIRHILSRATPSDTPAMECLSELMRGLEIPPAAAANMQPYGFYAIGRAIAEQAKQVGKTGAPRVVTEDMALAVRKEWESWAHSGHTLNRAWIEALNYFATSLPAARVRTIYDNRTEVQNRLEHAAPLLYYALKNLLDAVDERKHLPAIDSIESVVVSDARHALLAAAPQAEKRG